MCVNLPVLADKFHTKKKDYMKKWKFNVKLTFLKISILKGGE